MASTVTAMPSARMSAGEWQTRCDLAACYRLIDLFGWSDLLGTHISARVPGPQDHFLLNPYGMMFDEITASSLVKIDMEGNKVEPSDYGVNQAGFVIHSAVHMARHDLVCVLHTHTIAGAAVSCQKDGLLPLNQHALGVIGDVAYHSYEGAATRLDERERILAEVGATPLFPAVSEQGKSPPVRAGIAPLSSAAGNRPRLQRDRANQPQSEER